MFNSRIVSLLFLLLWPVLYARQTRDISKMACYQNDVHIMSSVANIDASLGQYIKDVAHVQYGWLNYAQYFDATLIVDPIRTRQAHKNSRNEKTSFVSVETLDGETIDCTFFDRGSDKIIFIGEGFTNPREVMSPFINMFPDYDLVLFDFRGQGYKEFDFIDYDTWSLNLSRMSFGVDSRKSTLGQKEDLDVQAVVSYFTGQKVVPVEGGDQFSVLYNQPINKIYQQVYGLGLCYSSFVFLKAASLYKRFDHFQGRQLPLFDKLVLDGCWMSLEAFVEKIKEDLWRIMNPQRGGWLNHWLWGKKPTVWLVENMTRYLLGLRIDRNVSIQDFVHKLSGTELFFIYGKNDEVIYRHEFEAIWNAIPSGVVKHAMITSDPHVRNHLTNKERYALLTHHFFEGSQNWLSLMVDEEQLRNYYIGHYTERLKKK